MIIKVLGSAAGGGLPQWNCNGINSRKARNREARIRARTQSSIAVSLDQKNWILLNASPDLRQQINNTPELHPRTEPIRNSPIRAVILTNGDVDHIAGLLNLREGHGFDIYASDRVIEILRTNPVFNVLNPALVGRRTIKLDEPFTVETPSGQLALQFEAFAVPGKVALYLEDEDASENFGTQEGDTIGLKITDPESGAFFFYIPGCATLDETLAARLKDAPLVFFDGTLFTDDEMLTQELSEKTGQRMGHISISGPDGSIAAFRPLGVARRIFIHINNSNPVLVKDSQERHIVEEAGWEVAFDGMEVRI